MTSGLGFQNQRTRVAVNETLTLYPLLSLILDNKNDSSGLNFPCYFPRVENCLDLDHRLKSGLVQVGPIEVDRDSALKQKIDVTQIGLILPKF